MAHIVADRVYETSTTTGTTAYTLAGAKNSTFQTFVAAPMVNGDTCDYCAIDNANGGFEIGVGTYSTGTLQRTTIIDSSNSNAAVSWAAGTREIYLVASARQLNRILISNTNVVNMAGATLTGVAAASFSGSGTVGGTTGAQTINWSANSAFTQPSPSGAITYTFTAPPGHGRLQLLIGSAATAQVITWPGSVIWLGSTWSGINNKSGLVSFWYNGTSYYATGANQV